MDTFFSQSNCDRCGASLEGKCRKMSWFTEDCLCEDCVSKETALRKELGKDMEGCGYVPTLDGKK